MLQYFFNYLYLAGTHLLILVEYYSNSYQRVDVDVCAYSSYGGGVRLQKVANQTALNLKYYLKTSLI